MSVFDGNDGHLYLRDARKAPFWTVQKLIADFGNLSTGRRILVLGSMSDIGSNESQKYRQLLRRASEAADLVIGLGRAGEQVSRLSHLEPERSNLRSARDMDEVRKLLAAEPPALVVLKGNKLDCSKLLAAVHPAPPAPAPYV